MSGLPPIDVHDGKMLPAVYRRTDIARSANVAGGSPPRGRSEGQMVVADGGGTSKGYTRSGSNSPPAVSKPGNSLPKGMIVDVWA
jgi:hypothetical protein